MPANIRRKISQKDKHAIVMLAESHRRDGVRAYVKRTSEELSIPPHKIRLYLKAFRDGTLSLSVEEVTQFSTQDWAQAKSEAAYAGMQISKQLLDGIESAMQDGKTKEVRDLAQAVSALWRGSREMVDGAVNPRLTGQQTNVQIVIPPKEEAPKIYVEKTA